MDRSEPAAPGHPLPPDELDRLAALQRYATLLEGPSRAFDDLVELASIVCDTPMAGLSIVGEDHQWFTAQRGLRVPTIDRADSFCSHTIMGADVLEINDAAADPTYRENRFVTGDPKLRFYAAAPVRTPGGHNLGTVCVLDGRPRELTPHQRRALQALARQAMDELELLRALEEKHSTLVLFESLTQKARDVMATIAADGTVLYVTPNVTEVLGFEIGELFGSNSFKYVHAADLEAGMANFAGALESPGVPHTAPVRLRAPGGDWRHLLVTATSYLDDPVIGAVVVNVTDQSEAVRMSGALEASETRFRHLVQHSSDIIAIVGPDSTIRYVSPAVSRVLDLAVEDVVGLRVVDVVHHAQRHLVEAALHGAGSTEGELPPIEVRFRHADGRWLWFEVITSNLLDDPTVGGLVINARDIHERKEYEAQLVQAALHDPLTGLPNRVLLQDRLEQALGRNERTDDGVALLFLDIDHFKLVNDSSGHATGDRLLVELARRVAEVTRPSDSVARFGGDEFVVLCEDTSLADAEALARRIRQRLAEPIELDARSFFVDVSIGLAQAQPLDDAGTLLQAADTAMYLAKERGRARVEVYEPGLREHASTRAALVSDLHQAVEQGQIAVAYQPIVRLDDRTCVGVEALARWHHPVLGTVPPDQFIPLAEDSGLIMGLGEHVLGEALARIEGWRTLQAGFYVSVNISGRQLRESSCIDGIVASLTASGLSADALVLELTETVLMQDSGAVRANLQVARQAGLRLAVDDFGTGYSSLAYLKLLSVALLKIDGTFVQGVGEDQYDTSIVTAITSLGTTLGLTVVAEHVESERQRRALMDVGCELGQGFLFAPAVGADEIDELLESGATFPGPA